MKTIPVTEIQISPERQRQAFDHQYITELRESIQDEGLFNAVVLRDTAAGKQLVQGECRLRAIQDLWELGGELRYDGNVLPSGHIPYTDLGELDPLAAEIAELHENSHRRSLSWQEDMAATARIDKIRQSIAIRDGLAIPTIADISLEVRKSKAGIHHENTRREIILAPLAEKDPEIKAAKSLDEAWKLAKRKEEKKKNIALATSVGRTFTADSHTLLNEDSLIWLPNCREGLYDVILTDPPYGMGADRFADSGGIGGILGEHGYEDTYAAFQQILQTCAGHFSRICKPQAHLYWFCDIDRFAEAREIFSDSGWEVHRTPLIYHKPLAARAPWPDGGPQRQYDLILYARKGKKNVISMQGDVLIFPPDSNLGHAAQKPVSVYKNLLGRSARPGDSILDPFGGTGPLIPAAHEMKCYATVIEKDASSFGLMLGRAGKLKVQVEMPV